MMQNSLYPSRTNCMSQLDLLIIHGSVSPVAICLESCEFTQAPLGGSRYHLKSELIHSQLPYTLIPDQELPNER